MPPLSEEAFAGLAFLAFCLVAVILLGAGALLSALIDKRHERVLAELGRPAAVAELDARVTELGRWRAGVEAWGDAHEERLTALEDAEATVDLFAPVAPTLTSLDPLPG